MNVSIGKLIDKYSVLEIKQRLVDVKKEMDAIVFCKKYIDMYPRLYKQLKYINQKIWDFMEEMHNNKNFKHAETILKLHNKKFRLKQTLNELTNSQLKDQKSFADDICAVFSKHIIGKLDVLGFLCTEYDVVYVRIFTEDEQSAIQNILPNTNLRFFMGNTKVTPLFNLDETVFDIPDVFKFEPIYYTSSGLLGDFITQLSIICENFYKTGRKGIVNMIDTVPFRKGLEETYHEVKSIVISQPYIEDLQIGFPDNFEIYLSSWRYSDQLYKINIYELFLQEYNVHFGKHKWIHTANNAWWNDKVILHIVNYRFPVNVNYQNIVNQYGIGNIVFLNMEDKDYEYFVEKTGIHIPTSYKPQSFEDLCIIINSCKLFVGATSMPLCVAHATHVSRIVGLPENNDIRMLATGLIHYVPNIVLES
jgi:hypothetical protein